jgi:50S ribosomal protein L16 3-hydroxylase
MTARPAAAACRHHDAARSIQPVISTRDTHMYFSEHEIATFWDALAPCWGREPRVIRQPFSKPFVSEREFLAVLKRWGGEARSGHRLVDVAMVDRDALPGPYDETLAATERNIAERWDKDWYLYIPDGVQQYDGDIWERAVELIVPAIRVQGGLPSGGMMLDLFFGKYQSTPTGIHLDSSDNLAFVTRGPKRMLFWPPDRFNVKFSSPRNDPSHQRALIARYEEHADGAVVIDAEAGDVIYWPKEFWHIGASQNTWSGMVSIPMWWTAKPSSLARSMLSRVLDLDSEPQLYRVTVDTLAPAALDVPAALHDVVSQMKVQVNAKLDLTAKVAWAKFVTSYGFTTPPALLSAGTVTDATRIRVKHPIVAVPLGKAIAVVGCGHSTLAQFTPLAKIVQQLQVGTEHTVGDLGQLVPESRNEIGEHLVKLVGELVSFRALEPC